MGDVVVGLNGHPVRTTIEFTDLLELEPPFDGFGHGLDLFGDASLLLVSLPGHAAGHFGALFDDGRGPVFLVADASWSSQAIVDNARASDEERYAARLKLQQLPRNANPTRVRSRCSLTGRPRGVYSKFGLGRSKLRDYIMRGEVPGVVKASW